MEANKKYRITNVFRKDENKRYPIDELYTCSLGVYLKEGHAPIEYIPSNQNGDIKIVKRINISDCYQGRETERIQDIFTGHIYNEENNGYSNKKHGDIVACEVKPISGLLTEEEVKRGYITLKEINELYAYITNEDCYSVVVKRIYL